MIKSGLYKPNAPWIFLHIQTEEKSKWLASCLYKEEGYAPVIRTLRGDKMTTRQGLMDEFGAALQFFEGFGENWHALKECLAYLDEWLPADAYILVITRCLDLLSRDTSGELRWFLQTIEEVGEWWSRPINGNDRFNRKAVPFHVILSCPEREVERSPRHLACGPPQRFSGLTVYIRLRSRVGQRDPAL
jgi:hypothetical protein